jgi:hypothetical protein
MAEDGHKDNGVGDTGFGYIADSQPREQFATVRQDTNPATGQPLKSALKTPGTAARLINPLSPTFREEVELEKQEEKTEKEQAKDLVCSKPLNVWIATDSFRKSKPVCEWPR